MVVTQAHTAMVCAIFSLKKPSNSINQPNGKIGGMPQPFSRG